MISLDQRRGCPILPQPSRRIGLGLVEAKAMQNGNYNQGRAQVNGPIQPGFHVPVQTPSGHTTGIVQGDRSIVTPNGTVRPNS